MPNNEHLVAQLQEDLNARDQALDDAATENNERELSRRDWFEEAQRLQAQLAERDALLREFVEYLDGHQENKICSGSTFHRKVRNALSASAEPKCCAPTAEELKLLADGDYTPEELWGVGGKPSCPDCHKAKPVERDERAEFESYMRREFPGARLLLNQRRDGFGNPSHQGAWLAWQARAALERKPVVIGFDPGHPDGSYTAGAEGASHE